MRTCMFSKVCTFALLMWTVTRQVVCNVCAFVYIVAHFEVTVIFFLIFVSCKCVY